MVMSGTEEGLAGIIGCEDVYTVILMDGCVIFSQKCCSLREAGTATKLLRHQAAKDDCDQIT